MTRKTVDFFIAITADLAVIKGFDRSKVGAGLGFKMTTCFATLKGFDRSGEAFFGTRKMIFNLRKCFVTMLKLTRGAQWTAADG